MNLKLLAVLLSTACLALPSILMRNLADYLAVLRKKKAKIAAIAVPKRAAPLAAY